MLEADSFTLEMRAAVPLTWVVAVPSTSRNKTPFSCSAVTRGCSMTASTFTVLPGSAASRAFWAAVTSNSAPSCSGMMESVAAS